jgi:hypothetical protein
MVRTWATLLLLGLFAAPSGTAKSTRCTFRVHAQVNAQDGSVFATPVTTPLAHRNIFIEKIPVLSEHDVAGFRSYEAPDGSLGALLQLNDHGRLALETLSTARRGSTVVVFVNGRAVTELLVDRVIKDGKLYIPSGLNPADEQSMAKEWPQMGANKRG